MGLFSHALWLHAFFFSSAHLAILGMVVGVFFPMGIQQLLPLLPTTKVQTMWVRLELLIKAFQPISHAVCPCTSCHSYSHNYLYFLAQNLTVMLVNLYWELCIRHYYIITTYYLCTHLKSGIFQCLHCLQKKKKKSHFLVCSHLSYISDT